jgi:hypothetical protein
MSTGIHHLSLPERVWTIDDIPRQILGYMPKANAFNFGMLSKATLSAFLRAHGDTITTGRYLKLTRNQIPHVSSVSNQNDQSDPFRTGYTYISMRCEQSIFESQVSLTRSSVSVDSLLWCEISRLQHASSEVYSNSYDMLLTVI